MTEPKLKRRLAFTVLLMAGSTAAFTATSSSSSRVVPKDSSLSMSDDWTDQTNDSNKWASADFDYTEQEDWQEMMARKNDGSFWSEFAPSADTNDTIKTVASEEVVDEADIWLDTLASISAEEIEFNIAENERADKVRQMQEWGFDDQSIENTFGVAMDDALEKADEVEGLKEFREQAYLEETDIDWKQVESHTQVEKDPETGEAIRQQMVYVDEHTCIGCTNCAMIAQSTFFMDDEHGRARVFQQWGDGECKVVFFISLPYITGRTDLFTVFQTMKRFRSPLKHVRWIVFTTYRTTSW